jgi:hypothetical protein
VTKISAPPAAAAARWGRSSGSIAGELSRRSGCGRTSASRSGRSKSEIAREALRKQLSLEALRDMRRELMPAAEAQGIISDEDVFDLIS